MRKIFEVLNFKKIAVVDKVRKVWTHGDYEIAVDAVKDLGDFVEVELLTDKEVDAPKIIAEMIDFLKKAGCGKLEKNSVGYPFMLLFKDEVVIEHL